MRVKTPLRAVWGPQKFVNACGRDSKAGQRRKLDEGDADNLNMRKLTEAIRSDQWWAYTHVLEILQGFIGHICAWAEECECHSWLKPLPGSRRKCFSEAAERLQDRGCLGALPQYFVRRYSHM